MRANPLRSLHPLLLALYPTAALLAHNVAQVDLRDALRPALVSLGMSAVLVLLFRLPLGSWTRAGILASLCLVLFFSYGHVYDLLRQAGEPLSGLGRHRFLLPAWLVLLGVGAWWITRTRRDLQGAAAALSAVAAVALVVPVTQILISGVRSDLPSAAVPEEVASARLQLPENQPAPDIYYIILDGYTRADVLRDQFQYDNSAFLSSLESLGFYIASSSRSNYAQTDLSLVSSLNMDYLDALGIPLDARSQDHMPLRELLLHSAVRQGLQSLGYRIVAFETGYNPTEWRDADLYLAPTHEVPLLGGVNSFESLLIQTSGAMVLSDAASLLPDWMVPNMAHPLAEHRQRLLFALDRLPTLADIPGPKFVFVHLLAPHEPFVFLENGEPAFTDELPRGAGLSVSYEPEDYARGYTAEITYLNQRLLEILPALLAHSSAEPMIILQGDHGAGPVSMADRMAILNAYCLPGKAGEGLDPSISPVNTFRLIFSQTFSADLPRLPDRSYFSSYDFPFDLRLVPED